MAQAPLLTPASSCFCAGRAVAAPLQTSTQIPDQPCGAKQQDLMATGSEEVPASDQNPAAYPHPQHCYKMADSSTDGNELAGCHLITDESAFAEPYLDFSSVLAGAYEIPPATSTAIDIGAKLNFASAGGDQIPSGTSTVSDISASNLIQAMDVLTGPDSLQAMLAALV